MSQLEETLAEATDNARRMYMDENLSIISDTSKGYGIPAGNICVSFMFPMMCFFKVVYSFVAVTCKFSIQ